MKIRTKGGVYVWVKHFIYSDDAVAALQALAKVAPTLWLDTLGGQSVQILELDLSVSDMRIMNENGKAKPVYHEPAPEYRDPK